MGNVLDKLRLEKGEIYFGGLKFIGVAYVEILPPQTEVPFVMAKVKDGTNVCSVCRSCTEQKNFTGKCNHDIHERAFIGVWTSYILAAAIRHGYTILQVIYTNIAYHVLPVGQHKSVVMATNVQIQNGNPVKNPFNFISGRFLKSLTTKNQTTFSNHFCPYWPT